MRPSAGSGCPAGGGDDPLDATDLALIEALASQVGPAVQAVRLHQDLVRSRAAVVALRVRTSGAGCGAICTTAWGPSLAAIRLKAGLAARGAAAGSPTRNLLDEIGTEVESEHRRCASGGRRPGARPPWTSSAWSGPSGPARRPWSARIEFAVTGPDQLTPLPAAVETAAYRIAVEGPDQRDPAQRSSPV